MTIPESFLAGAVGALAAFALVQGREIWRNRRNMKVEVVGGKVFYASGGWTIGLDGSSYRWGYDRLAHAGQEPRRNEEDIYGQPVGEIEAADAETTLFVLLDIILQNRSWLDDALTSCRLVLSSAKSLVPNSPADAMLEEPFLGANIAAHSLLALQPLFKFDGKDFAQIEGWRFGRETTYTLEAETIRGKKVKIAIQPAAFALAWNRNNRTATVLDPFLPA